MFLKFSIFLLMLFASGPLLACTATSWSLEGKMIKVCYDNKAEATLSIGCINKPCGARILLKHSKSLSRVVTFNDLEKTMTNPGAQICKKINGKVLMAVNKKHSQIAFCQAKDKSVVSLNSLGNNTF